MIKIGIGWLGFTEDQLDDMSIVSIVKGYEGKIEMLKAIFGSSDDKPKKKPSADELKSFAKTNNAVRKKTK